MADFPSAVCRGMLGVYSKADQPVPGAAHGVGAAGARLFRGSDS